MRLRFRTNVVSTVIVVGSILLFPFVAQGQTVAGTIDSSEGAFWEDIQLLRAKVFVSDSTAKSVLVYDANSLALRTEILLEPYLAHTYDAPFDLAGCEATGTLYVSTHDTAATSASRILMIDAESESVTGTLVDTCCHAFVAIDESRARLYVISLHVYKTVESFDLNTNTSLGTLDIGAIMGDGLMGWAEERSINKATGELAFSNHHYDRFLLVDGPNLTGETVSAANSRGYVPTWNWQENKLYITTIDWSGYFVHDRDTGVSGIANCVNDGTELFFSEAMNRIYSGAEVNHDTTIIDGTTDSCLVHRELGG
ncbi:MAG: hypothetical protein K8R59_11265 [Thermoanaerobaculales bacterium]|nr:hypothetical protein [Thermoanaerobaculales bacterium]